MKNHEFKRPANFMRYVVHPDPALDSRFNYEVTQEDLKYIEDCKEPTFTTIEFEKLFNLFEAENMDSEEAVKPFNAIIPKIGDESLRRNPEIAAKTYEYWKELRTNRGGKKGLLRKYWKPPDPMTNDLRVSFRRCTEEKRNLRRNRKYDDDFLKKVIY